MKTASHPTSTENEVKTFRRIRSAIGILGVGLPISLLILPLFPFLHTCVQTSISHYYYTNLREIFTGVLCATGLFLIRYQGTKNKAFLKNDSLLTNIAGYMAFGIALFPTDPHYCSEKFYTLLPYCSSVLGTIHYAFATVFFVILALISINVFTIGQAENTKIPVSLLNENRIYRTCGYLILFFILMVPVFAAFDVSYSTVIFEALALFAFGTSWLIKGRTLGDKGIMGEKLYRERN
jgi:hypothetical protein